MSVHHDLKTWPPYFEASWTGAKPFEIRYEDRGYQKGDTVTLREWDRHADCECGGGKGHAEDCAKYSGREIEAVIGFITASTPSRGAQRGFSAGGYVVFSLCEMQKFEVAPRPSDAPAKLQVGPVVSGSNIAKAMAAMASRSSL